MLNSNILRQMANTMVDGKSYEELIVIAKKVLTNKKYFTKYDDFVNFLDSKLTKAELLDLLKHSEIGYSCQENKIICVIDENGKPTSFYIADGDYDDDEWVDIVKRNIIDALTHKISDKLTDFVLNDLLK